MTTYIMYQAESRKVPDGIWLSVSNWQPTRELAEKSIHNQKKQYPSFEYRIIKITHTEEVV